MPTPLDRRVRKLEAKSSGPMPTGRVHLALVRSGSTMEAERAKLVDVREGDEIAYVRFMRPGDVVSPPTQH